MKTFFDEFDLSNNKIVNLADGVDSKDAVNVGQLTSATHPRGVLLALCIAFTPSGLGADTGELTVPYSPVDGTTSITWNVRRITLRVNVAGGAPALDIEKSSIAGAFSATTVGTVTMGVGNYEVSQTGGFASGTVVSGDKLRFNVSALGSATGWTITILLEEDI